MAEAVYPVKDLVERTLAAAKSHDRGPGSDGFGIYTDERVMAEEVVLGGSQSNTQGEVLSGSGELIPISNYKPQEPAVRSCSIYLSASD